MSNPSPILYGDFYRMMNNFIMDREEIRCDKPLLWDNTFEYVGLGMSDNSTSDAVWSCIRRTWIGNRCVRIQFRINVAWDQRVLGWT